MDGQERRGKLLLGGRLYGPGEWPEGACAPPTRTEALVRGAAVGAKDGTSCPRADTGTSCAAQGETEPPKGRVRRKPPTEEPPEEATEDADVP